MEKPVLKEGEILCDGCWKVELRKNIRGRWTQFKFNHLKTTNLCLECKLRDQKDLNKMKGAGL